MDFLDFRVDSSTIMRKYYKYAYKKLNVTKFHCRYLCITCARCATALQLAVTGQDEDLQGSTPVET